MNNKMIKNNPLFKKAEESVAAARSAYKGKKSLAWEVCYHSQQAVEQFLRAFLASNGVSPASGSLLLLNKDCSRMVPEFKSFANACSFLSFNGIDIRYPVRSTLSRSDATKAMRAAEQIQKFVMEKMQ